MKSLAVLLALSAAPALAQEPSVSTETIRDIRIERVNVFDPTVKGEDWWPFSVANKIHYPTRETVIRRELLFAPGDRWNALKVLESERNLRQNGSFRRADIRPVARPDGGVDAVVRTQDSWTTNPRFSAGTEGGDSFFSLGLEEGNILGWGKTAGFDFGRNAGKTSQSYFYGDPRFAGTRLALNGRYARGTLGDSGSAGLTRPFYSLDSAQAQSLSWSRSVGESVIYRGAEEFSKWRERRRVAEASVGVKLNHDPEWVHRAEAGWYADRAQFEPLPETSAGTLPPDRELSGPTLGYSWVRARYIKEDYIDKMERVEDFNLGNELSVRAGWMSSRTASDRDRAIFNASTQQGLRFAPGRFVIGRLGLSGRTLHGSIENGLATANLNVFWKTRMRGDHTLVAHFEGAFGRYLDRSSFLSLGGNTGLRGYRNNSFVGGKAFLVNFEDRFFFEGEVLHLMRLGAAVFVDSGIIAPEGADMVLRDVKSDVGAGLRISSTRSRSGSTARIDVAYALNDGPGRSHWVVSIRGGQAFSLFNSASTRVEPSPASRLY